MDGNGSAVSDSAAADKTATRSPALAKLGTQTSINTYRQQILSRMPSVTLEALALQPVRIST